MTTEELHKLDKKNYLPTFRRLPLAFKKARGSRVWDMEGNEYIDVLAGIAVNSVGHCHPKVVEAICKQAGELGHISNFYLSEPQALLAQKLVELAGMERVFFGNSGAEAAEGAIKIARKYASKNGRGGTIITVKNAFHGRTMATLAATGKPGMLKGFDPIPPGFIHVPLNDLDAIKSLMGPEIAGIMLEPVQGEGGINIADQKYIEELRALCDKEGIALIFDEIQTGMGRTGKWFAHQWYGVKPDIMSLAKALGNGMPMGAVMAVEKVATAMEPGDHGTTFGGNPIACAAALATIEVIEEEDLLNESQRKGVWLRETIEASKHEFPEIVEVRGKGLMVGVELNRESKPVMLKMLEHKVLGNATAEKVVRWVPPLNISDEDLKTAVDVFFQSLKETR
ncbi:MAG: acetylornithine transaminase [Cyclobacteriaceae bacterium]|nr:acetylornithine transaminase [Cyclobacteriaceae bacterium SS2]